MDTHIIGPRSREGKGAVVSLITAGAKFGDSALVAVEIFRTKGASSGLGFIQTEDQISGLTTGGAGTTQPTGAALTAPTTRKFPIFLRFFGHILTTFDGTGPVFTLTETNLDDSGSATIANIASFSSGFFSSFKFLTTDKKYKLTYTPATGSPTGGEGYYGIECTGPGIAAFAPFIGTGPTVKP